MKNSDIDRKARDEMLDDCILIHSQGRTAGLIVSKNSLIFLDTDQELTGGQPLRVITPATPRRYKNATARATGPKPNRAPPENLWTPSLERTVRILVLFAKDWWDIETNHVFFTELLEAIANWAFWRNDIGLRLDLTALALSTRISIGLEKDLDDLEANAIEPEAFHRFRQPRDPTPHVIVWIGNYPPETAGKARPCNGLLLPWKCPSYIALDSRFALEQFGLLHELGHLLGLDHEPGPGNGTSGCDTPPNAQAYVSNENNWHTIMGDPPRSLREKKPRLAYLLSSLPFVRPRMGSVALPIWSSPDLVYLGETAGSETQNNRAQLERVLRPLQESGGSS